MTFALYCYNKHSKIATKPLSLALSYAIEVAVGSRDIIRIVESEFTDERGFRNLIRVPGA
jgi:hypothetical protein